MVMANPQGPLAQALEYWNFGKNVRRIEIQNDESFAQNVKWINDNFGKDIEILEPDMPPIHEGCGLVIAEAGRMSELDNALKIAIAPAMEKIKEVQEKQGDFISWKQMQNIFDDGLGHVFTPVVKDDICRPGHIGGGRGFEFGIPGNKIDIIQLARAEEKMKEVVGDPKVWDMLKIDIEKLKAMFANRGSSTLLGSDNQAKIAIDCGVIRFPINEDPFFKIYRFRVVAVKTSSQVFVLKLESFNGLFMDYNERKYRASESWAAKFKESTQKQVDDTFANIMAQFGGPPSTSSAPSDSSAS